MIDRSGNVRLLQPVVLTAMHRAFVTILDDEPELSALETAMLSEATLAVDWNTAGEDEVWSHLAQLPLCRGGAYGEQNTETADDSGCRTRHDSRTEAEMRPLRQDDAV